MTQTQAVKMSTRLISVYLIYHAVLALLATIRYAVLLSAGVFTILDGVKLGRWEQYTYADAALGILDFALYVTFAVLFYRGGPKIIRFLTGNIESEMQ